MVINIEQTRQDKGLYGWSLVRSATRVPMFASQREIRADPDIIALVELDMQRKRIRLVLAREAIRERLRELERSRDHHGKCQSVGDVPDRRRFDK
jgi:hypothetical protein